MAVEFGGPVDGGAQRTYSPESYGKTVGAGGTRRSPGQGRAAQPDMQGGRGTGPTIPNMAPPTTFTPPTMPVSGAPTVSGGPPTMGNNPGLGGPGNATGPTIGTPRNEQPDGAGGFKGYAAGTGPDASSRALTPEESSRQATGAAAGVAYDAAQSGGPGGGGGGYGRPSYAGALDGQVRAYGDQVGQDFKRNVGELLGNQNSIGALRSGGTVTGMRDLTTNYGRQIGNYAAQTAGTAAGLDEGGRQFDAGLNQSGRQFDKTLGFNRDQFNADNNYRDRALNQSGSEFNSSNQFRNRELDQSGRQFGQTLDYNNRQADFNHAYAFSESNRDQSNRNRDYGIDEQRYRDAQSASRKRGIGSILGGIAGAGVGFMTGGPAGILPGAKIGGKLGGG